MSSCYYRLLILVLALFSAIVQDNLHWLAPSVKNWRILLGRLLQVDLITLEGEISVHSVGTSVRTSIHPSTKSFSVFSKIWYVDIYRLLLHDGMPYDPTQGQGQGNGASEFLKNALLYVYLLPIYNGSWQMTTDS